MDLHPTGGTGQVDKRRSRSIVRIIFLGSAKDTYTKLKELVAKHIREGKTNSQEMQLLKSIDAKIEILRSNPFFGDNIAKRKIPKSYDVNNLRRVKLTGYWRLLYTIKGDQIDIICFIVEVLDHKSYDWLLGYRKK